MEFDPLPINQEVSWLNYHPQLIKGFITMVSLMGEIGFVVSSYVELIPSLLNDLSCPSVVSCVVDTIIF
jgi:hypothetical protein